MSVTPIQQLLMTQLASCKMSGTTIKDKGITVSMDRRTGETVLFFHLDSNEGYACLGIDRHANTGSHESAQCCDGLIFYVKKLENAKYLLCFLEMKGGDQEEAVKQIISVYKRIKVFLDKQHLFDPKRMMACICARHQVPTVVQKKLREELKAIFGEHVHIRTGVSHYDIGLVIREHAGR